MRETTTEVGRGNRARCHLPAALLCALALLALSAPAGASAAKPRLSTSFGVAGQLVKATGTVGRGGPASPRRSAWRAVLQERKGKRWVARDSARLRSLRSGASAYALRWQAPRTQPTARLRVAIKARKRTITASPARRIALRGRVPQPPVERITAAEVQKLPSASDKTLVLDGKHSLEPGEFLNAPPSAAVPGGFLLKVISSSFANGKTTVKVTPASLFEAVPNGSYDLSLGNLANARAANPDAARLSRAMARAGSGQASVPFSQQVTCTGSASLTLNGSLDISLGPNLKLEWSKRFGIPTGIEEARATVDASLSAAASAELAAQASCSMPEVTLLSPQWALVVPIGPVLLPVTVKVPVHLNASASVSGSISVSASAGMSGSAGIAYRDGKISAVKDFSSHASLSPEAEAEAAAEAMIDAAVSAEAGWKLPFLGGLTAEIGLKAATGLRLTYQTTRAPPGKLCAPLTLDAEFEIEIPVVDDIEASRNLIDTDIKCVEFGGEAEDRISRGWKGTYKRVEHLRSTDSNGNTTRTSDSTHVYTLHPDGSMTFEVDSQYLRRINQSSDCEEHTLSITGEGLAVPQQPADWVYRISRYEYVQEPVTGAGRYSLTTFPVPDAVSMYEFYKDQPELDAPCEVMRDETTSEALPPIRRLRVGAQSYCDLTGMCLEGDTSDPDHIVGSHTWTDEDGPDPDQEGAITVSWEFCWVGTASPPPETPCS